MNPHQLRQTYLQCVAETDRRAQDNPILGNLMPYPRQRKMFATQLQRP